MEQDLPPHIQRQLDEAAEIEAAIAAEQATLNGEQPPADPVENTAPPEVTPPVEPATEVPEPPKAAPSAEEETWQARFHTLQGKFNAEVPRLHQQLREANKAVDELRATVEELKKQSVEPPAQVAPVVTSEDEEAFGGDLIAVVRKIAKAEAAEIAKANEAKVQTVSQKVEQVLETQASTAGELFLQAVAKEVPDWESINVEPGWIQWLSEYSPETGAPRQAALDEASSRLDSVRTAALFKLYKATKPAAPVQTDGVHPELKSQVAPTKTAAKTVAPVTDKIWTGAEYEKAFDVRLAHSMTEKEITELQAEAERAYNEGRVRW